ncbi:MAG: cbb3-type cytochrome c oxidase subunit I [Myxococcales bacterium]
MPPSSNASAGPSYLGAGTTVWSWLSTRDHKRIAIMYLVLVLSTFLLGGLFALALRFKLLAPGPWLVSAEGYNRLFTMHGVTMVFLFLIPSIPTVFGNFMLPLMIGAQDVAFPRMNLSTVYLFAGGACLALWGLIHGGADTGWTFYTPYSLTTQTQLAPVLLGVFIVGFSSILTGLNFIVTIHTLRAPGLTWMRLPLFVWSLYGTSVIQVLATPVLGMDLLLLAVEHVFRFGIFDPALGGDPVLWEHLFWFYSHPAVYIMILPTMGVVSEVVACFSRKNPFGYKAIVVSSMGIAFVGFLTWGHHLFVSGQSTFNAGVFGALSMLVGVFSAIKVFNWVGTLYKGSVSFKTPLAYVFGFLFLFVFGGMTGVAFATVLLDVPWHDTYFVVAHFHFIMAGGAIMGFLAALHYWFPKMFGRNYPERFGLTAFFLVFIGFLVTFTPQFLLGNMGMPRRYYTYPARFQPLQVVSTVGSWLLAAGFLLILLYLLWSLFWGEVSGANPWGSEGFEWLGASPPGEVNFEAVPVFTHPPHSYELLPAPEKTIEVNRDA